MDNRGLQLLGGGIIIRTLKLKDGDIVLRQPIQEDIKERYKLGFNEEWAKMCGFNHFLQLREFTMEDAIDWYNRVINHPCKWIIVYKGNCIGTVGLRPYKEDNKAKFSIEIYDSNVLGNGIGTSVTQKVIEYAFKERGYNKVFLRVLDYNLRAIKCYEKCGFIKEGVDREGAFIDGIYHSDIYMGILKSEYLSAKMIKFEQS